MLTPERRAELREYAAGIVGVEQTSTLAHPAAILALLDAADERDRLAGEISALRRQVSEMTDNLIDAGYSEAELGAERAALGAAVERVRTELSRLADESQRDGWDSLTMRGVIASIRDALDGTDE